MERHSQPAMSSPWSSHSGGSSHMQPVPTHTRTVTISGQSAGASIAIQHLFAFSSSVEGAAIAAGSPYGCGVQALHGWSCYYGGASPLTRIDVHAAVRYARRRFKQGYIDDPEHMRRTPVVLFSGKLDFVVLPNVMKSVEEQLRHFVHRHQIFTYYDSFATHVWPTDTGDCKCGACVWQNASGVTRKPCCNVNNCHLDFSGSMLRHFYGEHTIRERTAAKLTHIKWVDQWRYLPAAAGPEGNSTMLRWAPVYVPQGCAHDIDRCRVHVNYHGCTAKPHSSTMHGWADRLMWVHNIQLNEYAEANDVVVVYPQAAGSRDIGEGCFNWASYEDDPLFDTRLGVQLNTVINLLDDLRAALNHTWASSLPPGLGGGLPPFE